MKKSKLSEDQCISFDDQTLYTSHGLKQMLPRSLFHMVTRACKSPIQGVYYGKAINLALDKIFLEPLQPQQEADPVVQAKGKRGRSKANRDWFSKEEIDAIVGKK